ncbi:MAG: hypothetical protein V7718_05295 [Porticoccus sp.]
MKQLFSIFFYVLLVAALGSTVFYSVMFYSATNVDINAFDVAWLGVLLAALAPLVNRLWPYDDGSSQNTKVKLPKVSLLVMIGVAWVLLTVAERGWPLWLILGVLGGFLLNTYWAVAGDDP